ncbi:formylglycine-generating enzyme family protein [Sphingomonas sp. BIUV-7]|uniref:Formylglycine-generating enzyme family protein n=1 Tax=Sphingomonas natans TaxID=3063330 RepID=A0ABT8YC67_9SPHN|nr:formylglycine-generating enzyme family protein [Sphingomonas sp. BIUV-7]MDO6415913.1 formylglycine-generating enzyme family protein [Sphingomonas sp. BIUV-7]
MRLALLPVAMIAIGAWAAGSPAATAPHRRVRTFQDCSACSAMIALPAGDFWMGSEDGEVGRGKDEGPRQRVQVSRFALAETDVTRAQWRAFVEDTGRPDGLGCAYTELPKDQAGLASWRNLGFPQQDDEPVVCVSWTEAQAYVRWLSAKTGRAYRLPTEAEWEYAARAGTTTPFPWGRDPSHDQANYGADECCTPATSGRDRWRHTSPVQSFPPNRFGLYDMIGNVWQWTQDCYVDTLAGRPARAVAVETEGCPFRVARGGTWGDPPALIRSASRNYAPPPRRIIADYRSAGFGLRVATSDISPRKRAR